jgi:hypothetical protein
MHFGIEIVIEECLRGHCLCLIEEEHHMSLSPPPAIRLNSLQCCTILLTFRCAVVSELYHLAPPYLIV